MKRIESFCVDHLKLYPGLYVSRTDICKDVYVTTFDLRMTTPNVEPPVDVPALHTLEHLCATFLRNSDRKDEVVYFGPMGCRTGCYLVMFGQLTSENVYPLVDSMLDFVLAFEGEIPGAKPEECGNYSEQNITTAKYYAAKYKQELAQNKRFIYNV